MRTVQDIQFDVTGQTVYLDAPEGRPSSVTSVEVFRWNMPDNQAGESAVGAGSVETNPNTTLDDAAGSSEADPNNIPLTATTGVAVERTYLVTNASGQREWAEIESFVSGVSARAKHPLHNIYAATNTFQSTRIQATVDSTWVADETNLAFDETGPSPMFRVRWVYVVSGVTYVADSYFNLVRYPAQHGVRPQDMEAFLPGWLDGLPTDHRADQGRRLIDDAYRAVRIDLHQVDVRAASVAESEVVDELVRYKAAELREWTRYLWNAPGVDQPHVDASAKRYMTRLDSLIRVVSRVAVRDETGAATPVIAVGLTRR